LTYDIDCSYGCSDDRRNGRRDSCSNDRLSTIAAIVGATGRRDSRLVYTLQTTGRRNCRADRLRRRSPRVNTALMALPHWSLRRPLRRPIAPIAAALNLMLFGLIRQLSLLREEFRLSKFTLHSNLRRRAVSRLALPCTSRFHLKCITGVKNWYEIG